MIADMAALKDIPGFPDYAITKDGRVWSKPRISLQGHEIGRKWLSWIKQNKSGHVYVWLCREGKRYPVSIHRLVLETCVGPRPPGMECRHLDGNPVNNNLSNLKWGTKSENQLDSIQHGTQVCLGRQGEKHPSSKLSLAGVRMIIYMAKTGLFTQKEIAKQYGIGQQLVSLLLNRKRWKHIWNGKLAG